MNLLMLVRSGKLHLLRPSLHLFLTKTPYPYPYPYPYPFVSSSKFSTSNAEAPPPPKPNFSATDYLVQSCGLSSEQALRASKKIDHLKSPKKPEAVLRFLRETGIGESDIRKAVLLEPGILRSSVEKNWRPNVVKLQELSFSIQDISYVISSHPRLFTFNIVSRINFWMCALGSENLSVVLRSQSRLLHSCVEKVHLNLSFLKEQMGLRVPQITLMIKQAPSLITSSPEALMIKAKQAEELGVSRSSRMFVHALIVVSNLNQMSIQSRVNNLKRHEFSVEEVTTIVSKQPNVLRLPEESMDRKVVFLTKEIGYDKLHVVKNPALLTYSLDKRLIPRNHVRKLLKLKGLLEAKRKFSSFACLTEQKFVKRFVLPYEHAIRGLHQAYVDTCAGNIRGIEWFTSISS